MGNFENPDGFTFNNLKKEKNLWERKGYNIARSSHTAPNESLDVQFKQNAVREKEEIKAIAHRYEEEKKELRNHLSEMDKGLYALRMREEKRKDGFAKLKYSLLDRKNRREEMEQKLMATYEELGQKRMNRLNEHPASQVEPTEQKSFRKRLPNFFSRRNPLRKSQLRLQKALMQQDRTHIKNPGHSHKQHQEYFLITHVDVHLFPNLVKSIETLERHLQDNGQAIEDLESRIKEMDQKEDRAYTQIEEERKNLLQDQKNCFRRLEAIPQKVLEDQKRVRAMWQKRNQWILEGAQVGSFFKDGNPN